MSSSSRRENCIRGFRVKKGSTSLRCYKFTRSSFIVHICYNKTVMILMNVMIMMMMMIMITNVILIMMMMIIISSS